MLTSERFFQIASRYPHLRVAIVGDFCLDRYLEIDPLLQETSIETGLPVHNVVRVRAQPGGAGTVLNNLATLGVGELYPVGLCGDDGEGFELRRAMASLRGVRLDYLITSPLVRTFTYCKPLKVEAGKPPEELSRLDTKNWQPTPMPLQDAVLRSLAELGPRLDALIVLEQVDRPETGVVTRRVLEAVSAAAGNPRLFVLADSRRGLRSFPPGVCLKMNRAELSRLTGEDQTDSLATVCRTASRLASKIGRAVFVTLADEGMVAASEEGTVEFVPAHPLRGPIDIVGAGDCVTANLTAAVAAGASLREAVTIASAAASIAIHQLGTTGTASTEEIAKLLQY